MPVQQRSLTHKVDYTVEQQIRELTDLVNLQERQIAALQADLKTWKEQAQRRADER